MPIAAGLPRIQERGKRALAKDPAARFPSAGALADALEAGPPVGLGAVSRGGLGLSVAFALTALVLAGVSSLDEMQRVFTSKKKNRTASPRRTG